jgi:ATP-dependent RNA helicase HelY
MLLQSLAQFQSSQRIRSLEDEIISVGDQINLIPQGCLIGLDAGDELLEDYRRLNRSLTAAQNKERRLESDQASVERALESATPWTEPGRQALRRAFRSAPPGLVAHTREWGWGIYLNRGTQGGVGRFLFAPDGDIRLVQEYRQINQLTDRVIALPDELANVDGDVTNVAQLNSGLQLEGVWAQLRELDLPDLNALAAEHRASERARVDDTLRELAAEIEDARQQAKAMQRERLNHPCHACQRRNEHRDYLKQVDRLDRDRRGLEERLSREIEAEEDRIRGVIRGIRNVLHRFGYLHRGYPTPKADMLAAVFDNDGLILCELVERGVLDALPPEDLAEVFSWFSFDRDFRNSNRFVLPDRLVLARRRIEDVEHAVLGEERAEGLDVSEGHNPSFYGAARAWCTGATMAEINEVIDLSEGDLVLTFNKTIDLMRQVREMLTDVNPGHPLHRTLLDAERLMKRDIVEQSLLLGFVPVTVPEPLQELVAEPEPARHRSRQVRATPRSRARRTQPVGDDAAPAAKKRSRKQTAAAPPEPSATAKQPRRRRGSEAS